MLGPAPAHPGGATRAQFSYQMGLRKPTFLSRTDLFCCIKVETEKELLVLFNRMLLEHREGIQRSATIMEIGNFLGKWV